MKLLRVLSSLVHRPYSQLFNVCALQRATLKGYRSQERGPEDEARLLAYIYIYTRTFGPEIVTYLYYK